MREEKIPDKNKRNNKMAKGKKEYIAEYKEIERLRVLWSSSIHKWNRIFIPIAFAIISLLFTQFSFVLNTEENVKNISFFVLFFGGIFLSIFLGFWRVNGIRIDKDIVAFYPKLLDLEMKLGFEMQFLYYFNHLSDDAKKMLVELTGKTPEELNEMDYKEFKKETEEPQENLLKIWEKFKYNSVTGRGHDSHNRFAIGIIIIYFLLVIVLGLFI